MKIIFEKEKSRVGNDCMIYESFSILEMFDGDIYLAQKVTYFSGWFGTDFDKRGEFFKSESEAKKFLKDCGLDYVE